MYSKIGMAVRLANLEYEKDFSLTEKIRTADLHKIMDFLDDYCGKNGIPFVYGRGKRKSIHQRYHKLFHRFLDRHCMTCTTPGLADTYACHVGSSSLCCIVKRRKAKAVMNRKCPFMDVGTATGVLIKRDAQKPEGTKGCMFPKAFWKRGGNPMKIS